MGETCVGRSKGGSLAVGLMSGTSADGVSAALVRIGPGRAVQVLRHFTSPYSRAEQARLLALRDATTSELSEANALLGRRFAAAARRVMRGAKPRVIGSHGHTVWHSPGRHTLQIGEASIIAEETGVDVVADFRPRDIAAGGQGAPLVPFFDEFVFGGTRNRRALLNIGGIANVTLVGGGKPVIAFDTGPGNGLIDEMVRRFTRGRESFDRGGRLARSGRVDAELLHRLGDHPYFRKRPPKSTGRELFGPEYLPRASLDAIATLTLLTAQTIAGALRRFAPAEVIVSGGGVFNNTLMDHLEWLLRPADVVTSDVHGIPALAKECAAFALLAVRAIDGLPNTVPSATGARRAVSAGKIVRGGGA
jgi:anhydro-N-acetylmuramic acid kinase